MKNKFLYFLFALQTIALFAQKQNNNWVNDRVLWDFNNTSSGDFANSQINSIILMSQGASSISDKNTGALLFYTNGMKVYNKNHVLMDNVNGTNELIIANDANYSYLDIDMYFFGGLPSAQGSLIIPVPNSSTLYYIFSLVGNKEYDFDPPNTQVPIQYKYGLRYATIDMSLNGGLGKVTSKNNIIFSNTNTNVMTSCPSTDGGYWLVTQNDNGNYLSYKITPGGISSPVVSSQAFSMARDGLKISPNNSLLFDITGRNLFNFNNTTGSVTFNSNIIAQSNDYKASGLPCSAEFSEDSNVIYFVSYTSTLGVGKSSQIYYLSKYIISNNQLYGVNFGAIVMSVPPLSLQRHSNGTIYAKTYKRASTPSGKFSYSGYPGNWIKINNSNSMALDFNNYLPFYNNVSLSSGYTMPQLVPTAEAAAVCPDILYIMIPVTSSQIYQTGKSIFGSSVINDNLNVEYKAGLNVNLAPGFSVKGDLRGQFRAYINPCSIVSKEVYGNYIEPSFVKSSNELIASDVKIYPNPASTIVKIDSGNNRVSNWTLYDFSGKNILNGNSNSVTVENLPKSAYLLVIKLSNGNTVSKKIVVQ